jgi:LPS-assembly protein
MGLSFRPTRKSAAGRFVRTVMALALSSTALGLLPALAQTPTAKPPATRQQPVQTDRLFLQAQEMIYNRDANTIEARGQVQLYYQGRVLQAERVLYDRDKERVFAEGSAKLTEQDGTISYGNRIELTDDF